MMAKQMPQELANTIDNKAVGELAHTLLSS